MNANTMLVTALRIAATAMQVNGENIPADLKADWQQLLDDANAGFLRPQSDGTPHTTESIAAIVAEGHSLNQLIRDELHKN